MSPVRVAIVGAAGETGGSIANGLIEAGNFSITALTRPSSVSKKANLALKERGVDIVPADFSGPEDELVEALQGIEIVVSAIGPANQLDQIPLANAAKKAGVKRFLPCGFITVCPPGGIMALRDVKEKVYQHLKDIQLPYTIVDVGWWDQIAFPPLPSGKIDYAANKLLSTMVLDGNTPSALTDLRDIGKYIARIIVDERTIDKYVLAYNEVWTPNQVYEMLERLSGEKPEKHPVSKEEIESAISTAQATLQSEPTNLGAFLKMTTAQYQLSWGVRGDNTPEFAKSIGYLTSKELYPDMDYTKFEDFLRMVLDGKMKPVYEELSAQMAKAVAEGK